jgi:hypothetical protein
MSPHGTDGDRPRPGANQTGAGSLTTQLGAAEDPSMTESLSVVVERVLPYDGPHSADTLRDASNGLSALVRYLNNATGPWNAERTLRQTPDVADALGGLGAAVGRLDQLLGQLADALDNLGRDPTLYDDGRDRAAVGVAGLASERVLVAREIASVLATNLADAHGLTAHLGHDLRDGGEPR